MVNGIIIESQFALHHIHNTEQLGFDCRAYSKYKYGDATRAAEFGRALCDGFVKKYSDLLLTCNRQFMGISSPKGLVPPAAYYMFQSFLNELNLYLTANGRPAAVEHNIKRVSTMSADYSQLETDQRFAHLTKEGYSIDKKPLEGKFLLIIDDIRITGSHEKIIVQLLKSLSIENPRIFLYFAQLLNPEVAATFEHELNTCAVSCLDDIYSMLQDSHCNFAINTRLVKGILRADEKQLDAFLERIDIKLLIQLYEACLAANYHNIDAFSSNFQKIKTCFNEKQKKNPID
ncbi:unnamed protein product [Adineta ricciae]|uniref:Uncharacterized protein n=1 Tax=Adineta ricciae TaxID=249248 RepID=A0A814Z484_ADIRI|nr:unnamed protein product [Adineta ricciae]CAF1668701.1 unnamed protein product [Adineta ricciae]